MTKALDCTAIAELIPEFVAGLRMRVIPTDHDEVPDAKNCTWFDDAGRYTLSIGQEPRETSRADLARIRSGEIYTGDTPPYRVVESVRADQLGGVAVVRADSDIADEPGSMATVHLHTPSQYVTVAGWTLASVVEIAIRVAEKASEMS